MSVDTLQSLTSLLYQLSSWIFLRIIPAKAGAKILPTLYLIYVGLWAHSALERIRASKRAKLNGHGSEGSSANGGADAKVKIKVEGVLEPDHHIHVEKARTDFDGLSSGAANGGRSFESSSSNSSSGRSERSILRTLFSLPTESPWLNALPLVANTLLFLFTMDLLYSPKYLFPSNDLAFVRVGAVGPNTAKLTVRVPASEEDTAASDVSFIEYHPISLSSATSTPTRSPFFETVAVNDFTTTVTLEHLSPGLTYRYNVPSTNLTGTFTTAPDAALARSTGTHFTFLSTSCIKPNYPYNPPKSLSDFSQQSRLAIPGFKQLAQWLEERKKAPEFMLALGDWIYADTPVGAKSESWFRRLYRQVYANEHVKQVLARLPILAVWDDHEIFNNFAGEGHPSDQKGFNEASSAYSIFLGEGNWNGGADGKRWYNFDHGDASFFVLDTRPYRSNEWQPDGPDKTMLGREQKAEFIDWLHKVNQTATFKFVATSVPFTSLWGKPDGHLDTFAGYLWERDELMAYIETIPNVIFLSGDRHEFAAVQLRGQAVEFSTSPLSQFYVPYTWTLKAERTRYLPLLSGESETEGVDVERGAGGEAHVKKEPEEVLLKYLPNGNVKWGELEVNTLDPLRPKVDFRLWIDSKLTWSYEVLGEPIQRKGKQLPGNAAHGLKTLLL